MTATFQCAADAESRGELLAGTVSRADRFVLIEYPTPWPHKAADVVPQQLVLASAAASAKILLIRRPGERPTPAKRARRWAVYDARARRSLWGSWSVEDDLAALVDLVAAVPSQGWSAEPVALVCVHARHDACCGVRGRPVAAALAETHRDLVWECTHVGGHRFAANVVLPLDGTYYARLGIEDVADVVRAHLEDWVVSAEHLRGFSWMEPAAQAVAVEAHRRWGPAGPDDVLSASAAALERDVWRVELVGGEVLPSSITAEVERVQGESARLSCRADPSPTEAFVIRWLDADGA